MGTRTLISRNTWQLIQDNLIQSQENQKNFNQSHDLEKLTKQVETLSQRK